MSITPLPAAVNTALEEKLAAVTSTLRADLGTAMRADLETTMDGLFQRVTSHYQQLTPTPAQPPPILPTTHPPITTTALLPTPQIETIIPTASIPLLQQQHANNPLPPPF